MPAASNERSSGAQAGTLSPETEAGLTRLVRDVARAEILPRFRRLDPGTIETKTAHDDLVTEADTAAERALTVGVRALLPDARVVGEEAVAADPSRLDDLADDLVVILDPVDGTWNFANGIALFGVILAVTVRGRCVFGLLYDPLNDDWVMARAGGGCWFCRPDAEPRRLSVSPPTEMAEMTGFVSVFMTPPVQRPAVAQAMLGFHRALSFRCSCHEYRLMAQGCVDFMLNGGLNAWDHAAGVLCVSEAGGRAEMLDGGAYDATLRHGTLLIGNAGATVGMLRRTFGPALT